MKISLINHLRWNSIKMRKLKIDVHSSAYVGCVWARIAYRLTTRMILRTQKQDRCSNQFGVEIETIGRIPIVVLTATRLSIIESFIVKVSGVDILLVKEKIFAPMHQFRFFIPGGLSGVSKQKPVP